MLHSRQTIATRNPSYKPVALDKTAYEYIRSLEVLGLGVSGGYVMQDLHTEGCRITPSVTVLAGSPKSVFWDFNVVETEYNKSSTTTVTDYFSPEYFKTGNTFEVSNASYSNTETDLSGSYTFISFKNGVLASTSSLPLVIQSYTNTKFDSIPVFKASVPGIRLFGKNIFLITNNVIGSNSLMNQGVGVNSILEISDVKFKVTNIEQKGDKEYVKISAINRQDTISLPQFSVLNRTLINLYQQK